MVKVFPKSSMSLERFGQIQAGALILSCPAAALVHHPWPVVLFGTLGLLLLVVAWRGRYTPRGTFGSANAVSALRLAGVSWLGSLGYDAPALVVSAAVLILMALDGLDGFLARRFGLASDFGAHFDAEVDALLVITLGAILWQRERFGAWILWPGLLRYGYLLLLLAVPGRGVEPRSVTGRLAFGIVVFGLLGALLSDTTIARAGAIAGTLLVSLSFGRSLYYSYR
jgi:phosphatidylglycerophosphate synthase